MAHFLSVFWSSILAVYWLISGAFLSNLYERYCDNLERFNAECNDTDEKFILLPCMAFFCMAIWVSYHVVIVHCYVTVWYIVCMLPYGTLCVHSNVTVWYIVCIL